MAVLVSSLDSSVNMVAPAGDGGFFESRYVRRCDDYFIAYLSSHSGCSQACRFCHLTQTRQTTFSEASVPELQRQLSGVLDVHRRSEVRPSRMNVNFMARGEPLLSKSLISGFKAFSGWAMREAEGLDVMFNISSIFPKGHLARDPAATFAGAPVTLFWSLYSLDPKFRKRWLPKAEAPEKVADTLAGWQEAGGAVVLHWALIEGENDADRTFSEIAEFVRARGLKARLNLVRYNPHSARTGAEAPDDRYDAALRRVGAAMRVPGSRTVPRVGFDVKASCGMFVEGVA